MCLGIPMQVVEAGEFQALCEGSGRRERVDLILVGPQPAGAWLLVFLGAAREVLDATTAAQITGALSALQSILAGNPHIDHHFADLVARQPERPETLIASSMKEPTC
jgi:hydrogenase expression/formation protein HypC